MLFSSLEALSYTCIRMGSPKLYQRIPLHTGTTGHLEEVLPVMACFYRNVGKFDTFITTMDTRKSVEKVDSGLPAHMSAAGFAQVRKGEKERNHSQFFRIWFLHIKQWRWYSSMTTSTSEAHNP